MEEKKNVSHRIRTRDARVQSMCVLHKTSSSRVELSAEHHDRCYIVLVMCSPRLTIQIITFFEK